MNCLCISSYFDIDVQFDVAIYLTVKCYLYQWCKQMVAMIAAAFPLSLLLFVCMYESQAQEMLSRTALQFACRLSIHCWWVDIGKLMKIERTVSMVL